MIRVFLKRCWCWIAEHVFHDEVRLAEWLTMCVMLNFALEFLRSPEIVTRPVYQEFANFGTTNWAVVLLASCGLQLFAIFNRWWLVQDFRFIGLALAFAFFTSLTVTFALTGISTTATWTYGALATTGFLCGIQVLWNSKR